MAMYLGNSSTLGYNGPVQGIGRQQPQQPLQGVGGQAAATPTSTLGPQSVRASGPSQGFDPSYLQNLATAIGGLFSNSKQGGSNMNVNPLGSLSEISPPSGIGGTAPTYGEPMTWLQNAINGMGFTGISAPSTGGTTGAPQKTLGGLPQQTR